jgi:hypothetical protein
MGFLRAPCDFSFSQVVTTRLVRLLYAIGVVLAVLVAVGAIIRGFSEGAGVGIATLIVPP